jgi:hypothetical protein
LKLVVEPVQYQTERMRDFRRWDRIKSGFLGPLARTMGINIRLDRMDKEARRHAIHEWIWFTQYASTKAFIDFEGYTLDTIVTIEHLWTNDYKNFIVKEQISLVQGITQKFLNRSVPHRAITRRNSG